jgi:hypothetical protein
LHIRKGKDSEKICHGDKSSLEGSIVFDEGEYLRRVEFLGGRFIDNIRFQKTDGSWSNKQVGRKANSGSQPCSAGNEQRLSSHPILGTSGDVPARLRAMFEANRIYNVRQLDPDFEERFHSQS